MSLKPDDDDMLPEYDFSGAVRGKYYMRYQQGIIDRIGRFLVEALTILFRMWPALLLVAAVFVAAFFWAEIDPAREYGFGGGVLHGFFGIQNTIFFWFTEREVWAPSNTGRGYTAGFYVGLFVLPFLTRNIIRAIIYVLRQ
jgi:hypothetical protein